MANPVVHFEIGGPDRAKLQDFYTSLFEWKVRETGGDIDYALVSTGQDAIGGGVSGDQPDGWLTFYVQVDDCQAALDRAVELGAKVTKPVSEIPNMVTFAVFEDPAGNRVGVVKG